MPGLTKLNPPVRNQRHSTEFLFGQHSLFLAGFGQAIFYLHQFKPYLPAWVAGPVLLTPWGIVFVLFFHERPLFSPGAIRRWWLFAVGVTAFFTVIAEMIWFLGYMPPPTADHRVAADVLVQVLMNFGWLGFVPMLRDYHLHPELWT
jgi:hypothetical protein